MQATVESFDTASRAGTVVTDGGRILDFGAEALAEHIRHLRPGQRVHLTLAGEDIIGVALWP
jgi:hypothetical protein